jgi:hypothetical protein
VSQEIWSWIKDKPEGEMTQTSFYETGLEEIQTPIRLLKDAPFDDLRRNWGRIIAMKMMADDVTMKSLKKVHKLKPRRHMVLWVEVTSRFMNREQK